MLRNRLVVLAGAVALQASAPAATDAQQILLRYRPTPGTSMQTVSTTDVTMTFSVRELAGVSVDSLDAEAVHRYGVGASGHRAFYR